jgi:Chitobiase/beta-hexosaminidase C-terminal domain/Right handed beta helix region
MKYLAPLFLLIVASSVQGATLASTGEWADVQAKINAAATGDTVTMPPGTFNWSTTTVTIPGTKGITLQGAVTSTVARGAGTTGTTIIRNNAVLTNGTPLFDCLSVTVGATNPGTRITGIRFEDITNWPSPLFSTQATFITIGGGPVTPTTLLRIDNCYFKDLSGAPFHPIIIGGETYVLFDHCTFEVQSANKEIIQNGGRLPFGATQVLSPGWDDDVTRDRQCFYEDNIFKTNGPLPGGANSSIQHYRGARMTARYNTFQDVCIDVHGTETNAGGRWWEIYENDFTHVAGSSFDRFIQMRAGSGVIFNNRRAAPGTSFNAGMVLWEEDGACNGAGSYPYTYMIGHGKNMALDPAYIWNNTTVGSGASWLAGTQRPDDAGIAGQCAGEASSILINRDYFNAVKPGYTPYVYPHPLQAGAVVNPEPTMSGFTVLANGTTATATFSEAVNAGSSSAGWSLSMSGGAVTMSTPTGFGSTSVSWTLSRAVNAGETGTVSYTQPGGGFVDSGGAVLASITARTVTNTSTVGAPAGGTFYVGGTGASDSNTGTSEAAPFATIQKALSVIASGDTILVKNGTYNVTLRNITGPSGTPGDPCELKAFPGHAPVLVTDAGTAYPIALTGVAFWNIEGLDLSNGSQALLIRTGAHDINVRNCYLHDTANQAVYVLDNCFNLLFEGCTVRRGGILGTQNGEGFYIGSAGATDFTHHVTVKDCLIEDTESEAIEFKPNTHDCVAVGNTVNNCVTNFDFGKWAISSHPAAQWGSNPNHIIYNNTVSGTGDAGLSQAGTGAAFLIGTGTQCYNNVITNTDADGDGIHTWAVEFASNSNSYTMYFWNNTYTGLTTTFANIRAGTNSMGNNIGPATSGSNLAYNAAYFVNPGAGNFHLVAGSAPINSASSATPPFTISQDRDGNPRLAPIDIGAYEFQSAQATVATPSFSPVAGPYYSAQTVTITCSTPGATIRYTLDGSTPTASSPQYLTPLTISAQTTLSARGFLSGSIDSAVASGLYEVGTWTSGGGAFKSIAVPNQAAPFVMTALAKASTVTADALFGLGPSAITGNTSMAMICWFANNGHIQARSGPAYVDTGIVYAANTDYEIKFFNVNFSATPHTYSMSAGLPASTPVVLNNLQFRSEQSTASNVAFLGMNFPIAPNTGTVTVSQLSFGTGTAPNIVSATISSAGNQLVTVFDMPVAIGAGGSGGLTVMASGGTVATTGAPTGVGGTTLTWPLARVISQGETGTITYVQPGNGVENTPDLVDWASRSGFPFSNQSLVDTIAPSPNPATFAVPPVALAPDAVLVTASTGTDASNGPVQYFFHETSGNPGGSDSGWQLSSSYQDTGLSPTTSYTYTVKMRDSATPPNETAASAPLSVVTPEQKGARLINASNVRTRMWK